MSRRFIGMIAGWAFWIACVGMFRLYQSHAHEVIPESIRLVPDFLMIGVGLVAHPIGLGGWIWAWGDNGPPQWARSWTPDVIAGMAASGILGALASPFFACYRPRVRAALIIATLFALVFIISAIAKPSL